jgi:hypothetical protein
MRSIEMNIQELTQSMIADSVFKSFQRIATIRAVFSCNHGYLAVARVQHDHVLQRYSVQDRGVQQRHCCCSYGLRNQLHI